MDFESMVRPPMRDGDALRLGALDNAYACPLIAGLDRVPDVALDTVAAAPLVAGYMSGAYACSLIPPLDALSHPQAKLIPGLGVCSGKAIGGERLILRVSPDKVKTLAATPRAQFLAARLVLAERYRLFPELSDLDTADAVVVSADDETFDGAGEVDLASEWLAITELPLVLSVWATGFRAPVARLRALLTKAAQDGEAWSDVGSRAFLYRIGGDAMESLRWMLRLAQKHGICPSDAALRLC